jgi:hypothetical protein
VLLLRPCWIYSFPNEGFSVQRGLVLFLLRLFFFFFRYVCRQCYAFHSALVSNPLRSLSSFFDAAAHSSSSSSWYRPLLRTRMRVCIFFLLFAALLCSTHAVALRFISPRSEIQLRKEKEGTRQLIRLLRYRI